tara:strand:- start:474 stop:650 length:177 start_codon:yes stop_codon:yes gene_type:complete
MRIKEPTMTLSEAFLWPGTKVCEKVGVDPEGEAGLLRWLVNTLVYLVISLIVVWIVVV